MALLVTDGFIKVRIQIEHSYEIENLDSIKEYLPIKTLCKVFKVMLVENKYLNRGYVLDGFPKSYVEAKEYYISIDEDKPEDDETNQGNCPEHGHVFAVVHLIGPLIYLDLWR